MGRDAIITALTGRNALQSDLGYITTELGSRISTELDSKILFHIGLFYNSDTILSGRNTITTILN